MCRNIKTLFNFDPPATHAEIHASALQFVRKLSGFNSPSQANAEAFNRAVSEVADSARRLMVSLQTNATSRDREIEAAKAKNEMPPAPEKVVFEKATLNLQHSIEGTRSTINYFGAKRESWLGCITMIVPVEALKRSR